MRIDRAIVFKLSTLAVLINFIEGLEWVGLLLQLIVTFWLTRNILSNAIVTQITIYPYLGVLLDGTILYLMCISTYLSATPSIYLLTIGCLTTVKHLIHHKEIGDELRNVLLDF